MDPIETCHYGYDGPPPFIKFKGVTETVTSIRAWILGDGEHYSRTEAEVRAGNHEYCCGKSFTD